MIDNKNSQLARHIGCGSTAFARLVLAGVITFAMGFPHLVAGDVALASEETPKTAYELAQNVELTQAALDDALAEAERAEAEASSNERRIKQLEREIPQQEVRSGKAARDLYKFQQRSGGLVDLLLSAESFFDFLAELDYLNRIADLNVEEMNRLSEMKGELAETQKGLLAKQSEASVRAEEARAALEAAEKAQAEAEQREREIAAMEAEIAAMAAQLAEEPRANDEGALVDAPDAPDEAASSADAESGSGSGDVAAPSAVDYASSDEATFVSSWAARIDAYLAGSPLAGQGRTFAQAAWTYGVDPRFSPAISFTESSRGLHCFKPHNAWGWGSSSWASWEEAIDAHVRGLSRGYGYTISIEGAKKYCPPNWEFWYNKTLEQMNLI